MTTDGERGSRRPLTAGGTALWWIGGLVGFLLIVVALSLILN